MPRPKNQWSSPTLFETVRLKWRQIRYNKILGAGHKTVRFHQNLGAWQMLNKLVILVNLLDGSLSHITEQQRKKKKKVYSIGPAVNSGRVEEDIPPLWGLGGWKFTRGDIKGPILPASPITHGAPLKAINNPICAWPPRILKRWKRRRHYSWGPRETII